MRARTPFIISALTILAGSGAVLAEDINVWSSTNIQVQNGQEPVIHQEVRTTQDGVQQVFVQDTQQVQVQQGQAVQAQAPNERYLQQASAPAPQHWNLPYWQTSLPGTREFEDYFRGIFSQMGWNMQQWPAQMFTQASAPAAHVLVYLNGFQEVPSVNTPAFGVAHVMVEGNRLRYSIDVQNLTSPITDAHFHLAPPGVSGPAVHSISFNGSHAEGTWNLSDQDRMNIQGGLIYINVHTQQHPQGEIRAQL